MRKALLVVVAMLCTLVLNGCATVFSKSEYPVTVRSLPTQMTVEISRSDGHVVHKETTPVTVTLGTKKKYFKGEDYTIKLLRDGKVVGQTELESHLDRWYLGNMIVGGVWGMLLVDPLTGAMWALNEDVLVTESLSTSSKGKQTLRIATLDEVPEEKRASLVQVTN